jgi:hypothetical protein
MATPEGPRSQIRDIERHERVRARGAKAPGVKRGLDSRGLRELREPHRPPHRYSVPSSLPLTQMGWTVILAVFLVLMILVAIGLLILR